MFTSLFTLLPMERVTYI